MFWLPGIASVDRREQQPGCFRALLPDRLVHSREGRMGVLGLVDVVETNQADVSWDGQPSFVRGVNGSDGHRVAHRQDGCEMEAGL